MTILETLILAIVEGLTEFLPVSSTGHMIIAESLLGMESTAFLKAFTVIIQLGAILSVVVLYWRRFFLPERPEGESWWKAVGTFYLKLIIGLIPAIVVGLTLGDFIDENLESVTLTAVMLVVGGVFMLFCDRWFDHGPKSAPLTYGRALMIGFYQCVAAILPGTSRSMATIVGGMQQGLSRKVAAEFSFFLAVPTMLGATCKKIYDLMKEGDGGVLGDAHGWNLLLLGSAVAFVVGIFAMKFFVSYVSRYGFRAFGWYRIAVGLLLLLLPLVGVRWELRSETPPNTANIEATTEATNLHTAH